MIGYCTYITEHRSDTYPIGPVSDLADAVAKAKLHEPEAFAVSSRQHIGEDFAVYARGIMSGSTLPPGHIVITVVGV